MKIAIIDEGIQVHSLKHPEYVQYQINISMKDNIIATGNHGTHCAELLEHCTKDYELLDIKIVEGWNHPIDVKTVILALEICIKEKVDFICLSAGTEFLSEAIYFEKILKRLEKEGIFIIASLSNRGYMTLPASYNSVCCVIMDWNHLLYPRECVCIRHPFLGRIIVANIQGFVGDSDYQKGNSYAVPIVMGWILNKIKKENRENKKIGIEDIIKMFPINSKYKEFSRKNWGMARNSPIIAVKSATRKDVLNFVNIFIQLYNLESVVIYNQTRRIEFFGKIDNYLSVECLVKSVDCYVKCHIILCYFYAREKISNVINFDLVITIKERKVEIYIENMPYCIIPKHNNWEIKICQCIIDLLS